MKEIGGYFELETYCAPMLHEGAIALNTARNALVYLIRSGKVKKLLLPDFLCDSVKDAALANGVQVRHYKVGMDLMPQDLDPEEDESVYLVNYYGRLTNAQIRAYAERYSHIIVDNVQAYFQMPVPSVDTIYTCRKYFGVADGAFLYTDTILSEALARDESFERMQYLLGRFERSANEFYAQYAANEDSYIGLELRSMSKLTENLLRAVDYDKVRKTRESNYAYLEEHLGDRNLLDKASVEGPFMYPFLIEGGAAIRKKLQQEKIYVATLWPNVLELPKDSAARYLAENILPLPVDQRYDIEDMERMVQMIEEASEVGR